MIGLLGSTHCLGMCGGIVGALDAGSGQAGRSQLKRLSFHFTYNAGRIFSYAIAGAIAGLAGTFISNLSGGLAPYGRIIAGVFLIALGLYLADWWRILALTEKAGFHIWRWIRPLGNRFLPAKSSYHAFGLGLIWGWLPCGLVYSVLALALATGSPRHGALIMFSFGMGTLPMLIVMGSAAGQLMKLVRNPFTRQISGAFVILFGIYTCVLAFQNHHRHQPANPQDKNVHQSHTN